MNALTQKASSLFETMRMVSKGILPTPEVPIEANIPKRADRLKRISEKPQRGIKLEHGERAPWGAGASLPTGDL